METPAHILLVEDNRMDVELTLDAFHEAKLRNSVHVATRGQEALDYLFGRDQYADRRRYPLPNLILLDLKMPALMALKCCVRSNQRPFSSACL